MAPVFLRILQTQKRTLSSKLEVERAIVHLKDIQIRILEIVEKIGRVTSRDVATALKLDYDATRYHLSLLAQQSLITAHGERRGRYYTRRVSPPAEVSKEESRNAAILAEILEQGGSISRAELMRLVGKHGMGGRFVGSLHGRRKAHLARDAKTGRSKLTNRGREIAEQFLFTKRLANQFVPDDRKAPAG